MSDNVVSAIAAISFASIFIAVLSCTLYGCQQESIRYYASQRDCIAAGGAFVPMTSTSGACVGPVRGSGR